jgi:putative flippase GtrA
MSTWQVVNITVAILCSLIWVVWTFCNRDKWRYAVAPLSFLVHVVLFYISAALHLFSPLALNAWSNGVRLHSIILVGAIGIALICIERCRLWKIRK